MKALLLRGLADIFAQKSKHEEKSISPKSGCLVYFASRQLFSSPLASARMNKR